MHIDEYDCHQDDDDRAAADLACDQWNREHNRRARARIILRCQTTQEAVDSCVSHDDADMRETFLTAAAAGFVAFKWQVGAFVDVLNADIGDKDKCMANLDDKDMEELRKSVLEDEQWRLDRHCTFYIVWRSADMQSDLRMGEYTRRDAAEAAIPSAEAELVKFVANIFNRAPDILDGTWEVVRVPHG